MVIRVFEKTNELVYIRKDRRPIPLRLNVSMFLIICVFTFIGSVAAAIRLHELFWIATVAAIIFGALILDAARHPAIAWYEVRYWKT